MSFVDLLLDVRLLLAVVGIIMFRSEFRKFHTRSMAPLADDPVKVMQYRLERMQSRAFMTLYALVVLFLVAPILPHRMIRVAWGVLTFIGLTIAGLVALVCAFRLGRLDGRYSDSSRL